MGAPVQVLSGYIERVTVSVPWAALLKDNCKVELSGLNLTIAPHASFKMEEYSGYYVALFRVMLKQSSSISHCLCIYVFLAVLGLVVYYF